MTPSRRTAPPKEALPLTVTVPQAAAGPVRGGFIPRCSYRAAVLR